MNIKTLSYTEIQNLRIEAEINSYNTGRDVCLYDVVQSSYKPEPKRIAKPLPVFIAKDIQPSKPNNVDMRIRLRNHTESFVCNYLLVKESTLVNPDRNIISVDSPIGRILKTASLGDSFSYNQIEYTVIDISPTPKRRVAQGWHHPSQVEGFFMSDKKLQIKKYLQLYRRNGWNHS